jgi:hypothetical protein
MTYNKFDSYDEAYHHTSIAERSLLDSAAEYNRPELVRKICRLEQGRADSHSFGGWLIIKGELYYLIEMLGKEKGLSLLHRFEPLHCCIDNTPFIRIIFESLIATKNGERGKMEIETYQPNPKGEPLRLLNGAIRYSRDMKARKVMARNKWTMSTCLELEGGNDSVT